MTAGQRTAMKSLKTNHNIVIKPGHNGGAVVLMNRNDYCNEAQRPLNNPQNYEILHVDPTTQIQRELPSLLSTFPTEDQHILVPPIPMDFKPGTFYLLPMIHKPRNHKPNTKIVFQNELR